MTTIKVSPHVDDSGLGEIYQSMENKMALLRPELDGSFTRITPYVLCRDFIVDVFTYAKVKKEFDIYGMKFDPTKDMPLMDRVVLLMQFPNLKAKESFCVNLGHLHDIELSNDLEPTMIHEVSEKEVVIQADGKWLVSCLSWSFYTSLLRIFCYDLPGDKPWFETMVEKHARKTDGQLLGSVDRDTLLRVVSDLSVLSLPDWCGFDPCTLDTGEIHHNSGFYSVFGTHRELSEDSVRKNKHWQHFKEAGWSLHTK